MLYICKSSNKFDLNQATSVFSYYQEVQDDISFKVLTPRMWLL